jgi:hypothetical protein
MAGAFKIPSTNKNPPILNPDEVIQSYGTRNDQRADAIVNAGIACNRKPTPEIDRMVLKTIAKTEPDTVNHEVLIGSISVNLGKCSQSEGNVVVSQDFSVKNVDNQNSSQDKPKKPDLVKSGNNQATVKTSTPVSQFETKDSFPVQSHGTKVDAGSRDEGCQNSSRLASDGNDVGFKMKISNREGQLDPRKFQFNIQAAKAFLAQSKFC